MVCLRYKFAEITVRQNLFFFAYIKSNAISVHVEKINQLDLVLILLNAYLNSK